MKLEYLIENAGVVRSSADAAAEITGIASDSRRVMPGYVFVCIRGTKKDGNDYIPDALSRGAAAIVTEDADAAGPAVVVKNARAAESAMWNTFTGDPTRGMKVIAVTGTNGKTTVAYMLRAIFSRAGHKVGAITTVRTTIGEETVDTGGGSSVSDADAAMTTPDPEVFYPLVAKMRDAGADVLIFEASSHALGMRKLDPLFADAAVFTNLTEEHLDYHGTMEEYFRVKATLADRAKTIVLNGDDPYVVRLADRPGAVVCRVGSAGPCDVRALNVELLGLDGVRYLFRSGENAFTVFSPIPGSFTVSNTMLAAAAAIAVGVPPKIAADAVADLRGVEGRLEIVTPRGAPVQVVIDYAHTPAALESLLRTVRAIRRPGQKITVVFGCGGDRDRSKRKMMGAVASSLADLVIVTSDNPRSEDPASIIKDVMKGIDREKPFTVIPSRREAIRYAVTGARPGEIVVLAGKGHENYEITAEGKRPFCEKDIVTEALMRRQK